MKNKKKVWGIVLIVLPIVGLPIVLTIYAILGFVSQSLPGMSETSLTVLRIVKVILGLLGSLFVMGGFIAIPVGIVLLIQGSKTPNKPE